VYAAEVDDTGVVLRVVVAPSVAWCIEHLGGTWVETSDPTDDADQRVFAGIGFGHDDTWPEQFAPAWRQPEGAHDAYDVDALVFHGGRMWQNITPANVWEPGVSGWRDTPAVGLPIWVQPTGAHDAYPLGAQVTHNGQNWQSTVNANVWPPGVFGWVVI
jgi:hypothetical protein